MRLLRASCERLLQLTAWLLRKVSSTTPATASEPEQPRKRARATALHVLAVLTRATFPVPYQTIAQVMDRDPLTVLMCLIELEALGLVCSRALSDGGVLYSVAPVATWGAMP